MLIYSKAETYHNVENIFGFDIQFVSKAFRLLTDSNVCEINFKIHHYKIIIIILAELYLTSCALYKLTVGDDNDDNCLLHFDKSTEIFSLNEFKVVATAMSAVACSQARSAAFPISWLHNKSCN